MSSYSDGTKQGPSYMQKQNAQCQGESDSKVGQSSQTHEQSQDEPAPILASSRYGASEAQMDMPTNDPHQQDWRDAAEAEIKELKKQYAFQVVVLMALFALGYWLSNTVLKDAPYGRVTSFTGCCFVLSSFGRRVVAPKMKRWQELELQLRGVTPAQAAASSMEKTQKYLRWMCWAVIILLILQIAINFSIIVYYVNYMLGHDPSWKFVSTSIDDYLIVCVTRYVSSFLLSVVLKLMLLVTALRVANGGMRVSAASVRTARIVAWVCVAMCFVSLITMPTMPNFIDFIVNLVASSIFVGFTAAIGELLRKSAE